MNPKTQKHPLNPVVIPGSWCVLFVSAIVFASNPWGASGHPAIGLAVVYYVLMAAPLFGFAGCLYAAFGKAPPSRAKQIAIVVDAGFLIFGLVFWAWSFH